MKSKLRIFIKHSAESGLPTVVYVYYIYIYFFLSYSVPRSYTTIPSSSYAAVRQQHQPAKDKKAYQKKNPTIGH